MNLTEMRQKFNDNVKELGNAYLGNGVGDFLASDVVPRRASYAAGAAAVLLGITLGGLKYDMKRNEPQDVLNHESKSGKVICVYSKGDLDPYMKLMTDEGMQNVRVALPEVLHKVNVPITTPLEAMQELLPEGSDVKFRSDRYYSGDGMVIGFQDLLTVDNRSIESAKRRIVDEANRDVEWQEKIDADMKKQTPRFSVDFGRDYNVSVNYSSDLKDRYTHTMPLSKLIDGFESETEKKKAKETLDPILKAMNSSEKDPLVELTVTDRQYRGNTTTNQLTLTQESGVIRKIGGINVFDLPDSVESNIGYVLRGNGRTFSIYPLRD